MVRIIFFVNYKGYYNSSECYADHHLMCMASLQKKNHNFGLMRGEGIHGSIDEQITAILGNLYLILVYYGSHYPHAQFQLTGTKIGVTIHKTV